MADRTEMADMHNVVEVSAFPKESGFVENVIFSVVFITLYIWELLNHLEGGFSSE